MTTKIEVSQEKILEIKELYEAGNGTRRIAEKTGYKRDVIKRVIRENRLEKKGVDKYPSLTKEVLNELYNYENLSVYEICRGFNCPKDTVLNRMEKYGIKRRGYKERSLGISNKQVMNMYDNGMTQTEISLKLKCSLSTINKIVKKESMVRTKKVLITIPTEILVDLYVTKKVSIYLIAKEFHCDPSTIRLRLKDLGIIKGGKVIDAEKLKRLCDEGKSLKELMKEFEFGRQKMLRMVKAYGYEIRQESLAKVTYNELYNKLIVQGRSRSDVANDYGVSSSTLGDKLRELGLNMIKERNEYKGITKEALEDMYYNQGLTQRQIAEKLHMNRSSVTNLFKKRGIKRKETKYEESLTYDILKEYYVDKNMPPVAIAKELGVPANPIRKKVIEWGLKDLKTKEEQEICRAKAYSISLNCHRSKGEKELASLYPFDKVNDSTVIGLELDMYCSDKKLAVEYNGDYWHSTKFHRNSGLHLAKLSICENKGIRLINIFERDWLGRTRKKIEAHLDRIMYPERMKKVEGEIKVVHKYLQEPFERKNNFFNYRESQHCIGTFKDNKLINTLSYNIEKDKITVVNYTTEVGYKEDFNNLITCLKEEMKLPIVLICDKRYYNDEFPKRMGFKHLKDKEPELYYVLNTKALRKEEASEEYLKNPKCFEVYDCGSSIWILD